MDYVEEKVENNTFEEEDLEETEVNKVDLENPIMEIPNTAPTVAYVLLIGIIIVIFGFISATLFIRKSRNDAIGENVEPIIEENKVEIVENTIYYAQQEYTDLNTFMEAYNTNLAEGKKDVVISCHLVYKDGTEKDMQAYVVYSADVDEVTFEDDVNFGKVIIPLVKSYESQVEKANEVTEETTDTE